MFCLASPPPPSTAAPPLRAHCRCPSMPPVVPRTRHMPRPMHVPVCVCAQGKLPTEAELKAEHEVAVQRVHMEA